jgi:hypothetical protein
MQLQDISDRQVLGAALVTLGLALGGASAVAGLIAFDHMAWAAELCGPATGHCLRCVAAAGLAVAALGTFAAGLRLLRSLPVLQVAR